MADTTKTSTDAQMIQTPVTVAEPTSEMESILAELRPIAKYKARSHDTSKNAHIPLLQSHIKDGPDKGPTVVLLGDSMFERMTTTGESPNFVAPWPSPAMLSDETIALYDCHDDEPKLKRLDRVFNAGVGGDKIQNLVYRLVGATHPEDEEKDLPGLLPMLAACGTVKTWIVHIGTNNLSSKRGLSFRDREALLQLGRALRRINRVTGKESELLVTGLFYRKDVPKNLVYRANEDIQGVTKALEDEFGVDGAKYLLPPVGIDTAEHLVDHVHLNLEGYRLWAEPLFNNVVCSLEKAGRRVLPG